MSNDFIAVDPATGEPTWSGRAATGDDVNRAVVHARAAFEEWSILSVDERAGFLLRFKDQIATRRNDLIEAICRSTGKPRWESATEVDAVVGKVDLTLQAHRERRAETSREVAGTHAITRYKPHGVVAIFGPFNFPAHLPNGHILPAMLEGNTVIFKPSEQTPLVGQVYAEIWKAAGVPPGVFQLIQGGRATGEALAPHRDVDGLLFTGGFAAGTALARAAIDQPGKILALEMGGNNPLIVHDVSDLDAAAYWTIQSAFITAGQRCSCARRLILFGNDRRDEEFLDRLGAMTKQIVVGPYTQSPEPFMGPVISEDAARKLLAAQQELQSRGARSVIEMRPLSSRATMLSPGIIDVTSVNREDVELFGPLLQVIRVTNFDAAMREANNTRYGLAAGLFSDDRPLFDAFYRKIRAGVVNWNRPTTGATGHLPFGGVKNSGNHRPSGYFAVDYCSYPVASMESAKLEMPKTPAPGIVLSPLPMGEGYGEGVKKRD
jgi:succinylglutamic semialdehyde dehydrogenase